MSLHLPNDLAAAAMRMLDGVVSRRLQAAQWRRGYRPERHYMRGPGPASRARHTETGLGDNTARR